MQPIEVVNSTIYSFYETVILIDIWLPTDGILELYDNIHAGEEHCDTKRPISIKWQSTIDRGLQE
jgi:hypothetical protein